MVSHFWQSLTRNRVSKIGPVAPLETLVALDFEGPDARSFLQGYLTCDMDALSATPVLAALCNLKGRVVANGWCLLAAPDRVRWIVHVSLADPVAGFMAKYLAFSKTRLHWSVAEQAVVGALSHGGEVLAFPVYAFTDLEQIQRRHDLPGPDDWHRARLARSIAIVDAASSERYLPQMLGLVALDAIDFDKGCYLGQEVVARAQHRGQVKRSLRRLVSTEPASPGPVADRAGREAGRIIDCHGLQSLAVLRDEAVPPFTQDDLALDLAS